MKSYLYWIYNSSCDEPQFSGYIGVTLNPTTRFRNHLRSKRVPDDCQIKILFEGSREECFSLENELRPTKNIGWNNAVGGSHGWKHGFTHSSLTKEKMKEKWTPERKAKASDFKTLMNKKLKGQSRPKQSEKMIGENNPMFGKKRPNHVKEAVSKAQTGKTPINKQYISCLGCKQHVNKTILNKYHNKCFKMYYQDIIK